jgi:SAM-dependent methyltransferase
MKTAMVTLGIVNGTTATSVSLVTIATNLLKIALAGLGIGLVIAAIVLLYQNWDKVTEAVGKVWDMIKEVVPKAWAKVKELKDKVVDFVGDIIEAYLSIPAKMLGIGKDIVYGIWNGIQSVAGWLKNKVFDFFGNLVPSWAKKVLGIGSPSKVFARYGRFIVEGLAVGIERSADLAKEATQGLGIDTISAFPNVATPRLQTGTARVSSPINITINAGAGTDPYSVGRAVTSAIDKYSRISSAPNQRVTL